MPEDDLSREKTRCGIYTALRIYQDLKITGLPSSNAWDCTEEMFPLGFLEM